MSVMIVADVPPLCAAGPSNRYSTKCFPLQQVLDSTIPGCLPQLLWSYWVRLQQLSWAIFGCRQK